jgi:hypothetical protein
MYMAQYLLTYSLPSAAESAECPWKGTPAQMSPPRNLSTLPRYNPTQPEQAQPGSRMEHLSHLLLEC